MAINREFVVYKTDAGFEVPAVLTAAYDTNGDVTTDISDTVTGDLIVIGYANTKLTSVDKGTDAGEFAFLSAYSA